MKLLIVFLFVLGSCYGASIKGEWYESYSGDDSPSYVPVEESSKPKSPIKGSEWHNTYISDLQRRKGQTTPTSILDRVRQTLNKFLINPGLSRTKRDGDHHHHHHHHEHEHQHNSVEHSHTSLTSSDPLSNSYSSPTESVYQVEPQSYDSYQQEQNYYNSVPTKPPIHVKFTQDVGLVMNRFLGMIKSVMPSPQPAGGYQTPNSYQEPAQQEPVYQEPQNAYEQTTYGEPTRQPFFEKVADDMGNLFNGIRGMFTGNSNDASSYGAPEQGYNTPEQGYSTPDQSYETPQYSERAQTPHIMTRLISMFRNPFGSKPPHVEHAEYHNPSPASSSSPHIPSSANLSKSSSLNS